MTDDELVDVQMTIQKVLWQTLVREVQARVPSDGDSEKDRTCAALGAAAAFAGQAVAHGINSRGGPAERFARRIFEQVLSDLWASRHELGQFETQGKIN